jgi:hypothetical protein
MIVQCNDRSLHAYLDQCLDIVTKLDYILIHHILRHENWRADELTQQASGYHVIQGMFLYLNNGHLAARVSSIYLRSV